MKSIFHFYERCFLVLKDYHEKQGLVINLNFLLIYKAERLIFQVGKLNNLVLWMLSNSFCILEELYILEHKLI